MSHKHTGKLVAFPNLKRRVIEKATFLMEERRYLEALPLFRQAVEMDKENPELLIGLVMCLFELGELEEAKEHCQEMLREGIGDYYHILQVYLMVMIQAGDYEEGYTTLSAIIQEQRLPAEHAEHFYKLLEFFKARTSADDAAGQSEEMRWEAFRAASIAEQMEIINSLKGANVKRYVSLYRNILKEEAIHPIIKTLTAKWLMTEGMSGTEEVIKFNRKRRVDVSYLHSVAGHPFVEEVEKALEYHIGQLNPTLLKLTQELWHRHLFVLFPFMPDPLNASVWASAIHYAAMEMQGLDSSLEYMMNLYEVEEAQMMNAIETVKEIEEFSSI
jgi:tetratricopeptide (TPR) repeat protein